jgi:hypothetical protein
MDCPFAPTAEIRGRNQTQVNVNTMSTFIDLYYGQSGTGKSEAAVAIIKREYAKTKKRSRVILGDGSGANYAALAQAGIVEMLDYSARDWPLTTMEQLCDGWWPENQADPSSPLLPPKPGQLNDLAVVVIEGLAVIGAYIMGDRKGGLAEQSARGIKIGQDSPVRTVDCLFDDKGNVVKGSGPGTAFGGNPPAHYGFAQRRINGYVERTKVFPGIVIFTSHERAAEDKISKETLIGPEVVGGAMTAAMSRQFNNTLHFATAASKAKAKDSKTAKLVDELDVEYRIYTRDHFSAEQTTFLKYKAVSRCADPDKLPDYLTGGPGQAILEFYRILDATAAEQVKKLLDSIA